MRIYFIGIGGIGISALAKYYLLKGNEVYGSDVVNSDLIEEMQKMGAKINIGPQKKENLASDFDLVVFTPAVKNGNEEYLTAKDKGMRLLSYPEALGELSKSMFTIAISGTHGKSTTTTMIALLLKEANLDPTVIVGTKVKEFGNSNFRMGKSKYLVIEACEYEDSFLNYNPDIGVILNIEADHLDYFKTFENVKKSFEKFALQSKKVLLEKTFENHINSNNKVVFDKEKEIKPILNIPGEFNITNAMFALNVAKMLNIKDETSLKALSKFNGTWRRMEIDDTSFDFTIINDYGHHPTAIKVTLKAIKEKYPTKDIYCLFQPHQYERTFNLFDDFKDAFKKALEFNFVKKVLIYDIYTVKGRESEETLKKVNSEKLVQAINDKNCLFIESFEKANEFVKNNLKKNDVLVIMGAGNIYDFYEYLKLNKN
ncbi:MAG: Mur ligase family protein [Candidatus Pacebacteria bacterium]|nr:Mur ligase family protein [Candidatus Paceibacterota bacterium]